MSWLIYVVYCLSMLIFASLVFMAVTRNWRLPGGVVHYRGERWGTEGLRFFRILATTVGALFGCAAVHLFVRDQFVARLIAEAMVPLLLVGVFAGSLLLVLVVCFLGLLWFQWLQSLVTSDAPERPDL